MKLTERETELIHASIISSKWDLICSDDASGGYAHLFEAQCTERLLEYEALLNKLELKE